MSEKIKFHYSCLMILVMFIVSLTILHFIPIIFNDTCYELEEQIALLETKENIKKVDIEKENVINENNKIMFIREGETIICDYTFAEKQGNYYYIETSERHYWLTPQEIKTIKKLSE